MRDSSRFSFVVRSACSLCVLFAVACGESSDDDDELSCEEAECTDAPVDTCDEDGNAIHFGAVGTCQANVCAYPIVIESCEAQGATCAAGACVAP